MKKSNALLLSIACLLLIGLYSCKKPTGCIDPLACNYDPDAKKDDGSCQGKSIWYADVDGDGLGNPSDTTSSCTQPVGYVDNGDDLLDAVIEKKAMGLITKMTATWCGPCGSWGWTLFEDIISGVSNEALIMGVYSPASSELTNATAEQWGNDFNAQGWPSFCVNGKNRTEYSSTGGIFTSTTASNCINASDSTAGTNPLAAMTYQKIINGSTLTVNTATKFYANLSGQYYLGAYIVEDGVIADQSGDAGPGASHHFVLRGSMDGNVYGTLIKGGSVEANETIEQTFTMELDASWVTENITVGLVLWNQVNGSYLFMNAYKEEGGH